MNRPRLSRLQLLAAFSAVLLVSTTGCNDPSQFGRISGVRHQLKNIGPLIDNPAELTGYDPHRHIDPPRPDAAPARLGNRHQHI